MIALWSLTVVAALLAGAIAGWLFALRQTPSTLAKLDAAQLKTLAKRVAERRKVA